MSCPDMNREYLHNHLIYIINHYYSNGYYSDHYYSNGYYSDHYYNNGYYSDHYCCCCMMYKHRYKTLSM